MEALLELKVQRKISAVRAAGDADKDVYRPNQPIGIRAAILNGGLSRSTCSCGRLRILRRRGVFARVERRKRLVINITSFPEGVQNQQEMMLEFAYS